MAPLSREAGLSPRAASGEAAALPAWARAPRTRSDTPEPCARPGSRSSSAEAPPAVPYQPSPEQVRTGALGIRPNKPCSAPAQGPQAEEGELKPGNWEGGRREGPAAAPTSFRRQHVLGERACVRRTRCNPSIIPHGQVQEESRTERDVYAGKKGDVIFTKHEERWVAQPFFFFFFLLSSPPHSIPGYLHQAGAGHPGTQHVPSPIFNVVGSSQEEQLFHSSSLLLHLPVTHGIYVPTAEQQATRPLASGLQHVGLALAVSARAHPWLVC